MLKKILTVMSGRILCEKSAQTIFNGLPTYCFPLKYEHFIVVKVPPVTKKSKSIKAPLSSVYPPSSDIRLVPS